MLVTSELINFNVLENFPSILGKEECCPDVYKCAPNPTVNIKQCCNSSLQSRENHQHICIPSFTGGLWMALIWYTIWIHREIDKWQIDDRDRDINDR